MGCLANDKFLKRKQNNYRVFIKYCVFQKFRIFRTLAFICFPLVSACVHTPGRQNTSPTAELAELRKIKEKTQFLMNTLQYINVGTKVDMFVVSVNNFLCLVPAWNPPHPRLPATITYAYISLSSEMQPLKNVYCVNILILTYYPLIILFNLFFGACIFEK